MAEASELDSLPAPTDPHWVEGKSKESLDAFLARYRPSEGSADWAWIWIRKGRDDERHRDPEAYLLMTAEAQSLTSELDEEVKRINDDASIPIRGSKKSGLSKKQHREALHGPFAKKLKDLAFKYNEKSGKLLFYYDSTAIDDNFAKLARAMINEDGAFRDLPVHCIKVASQPNAAGAPRVICLYLEDSWDKEAVKKTWKALMHDVGLMSKSFKADIYTLAGITSTHPSGIKSTLWSASDLFTKEEIEEAFDAKKGKTVKPASEAQEQARGGQDFADSDTEDEDAAPPAKKQKT